MGGGAGSRCSFRWLPPVVSVLAAERDGSCEVGRA